MATPTSRQRKPNFSHEESSKLLEMIVIHYNVITQPGNNLEANKSKKASWDVISQEVSQVAQVLRDDKECRKKWRVSIQIKVLCHLKDYYVDPVYIM